MTEVNAIMASRIVARRAFEYLEEIDRGGGKAKRMDFYRIAGSEANLNRWISYLTDRGLIREIEEETHRYYVKTPKGEEFHHLLKNWEFITIFMELSGPRLRRRY